MNDKGGNADIFAQPHAMDPPPSMTVHRKSIRSEFTLNSTLQIECDDDKILQQFNAVREYSPNYGKPAKTVTIGDFLEMDIIGQWNKSFIVTRLDGSIIAIDQHAACEAQNFEKLRNKKKKPQKLIQPVKLAVSPDELQNAELYSEKIAELGFQYTIEGDAILIQTIPSNHTVATVN